jgi:hypothetical protein
MKMAAASGGWILAEICPVRFVNSSTFNQEMSGPTGLVRTFFRGLKGKLSYRLAGWESMMFRSTAWVWRFQDESCRKKSTEVNSRNDLSS